MIDLLLRFAPLDYLSLFYDKRCEFFIFFIYWTIQNLCPVSSKYRRQPNSCVKEIRILGIERNWTQNIESPSTITCVIVHNTKSMLNGLITLYSQRLGPYHDTYWTIHNLCPNFLNKIGHHGILYVQEVLTHFTK